MSEPGDNENNLDKVAETLARESNINKYIIIKNIDKTHHIEDWRERSATQDSKIHFRQFQRKGI